MNIEFTTKDITNARKSGDLVNAYKMSKVLIKEYPDDEWVIRAYAWTLIDLCKKEKNNENSENLKYFINELNSLNIQEDDEILYKQYKFVLNFNSEFQNNMKKAYVHSKNGEHKEALSIYSKLNLDEFNDYDYKSYAWEIYYNIKESTFIDVKEFKKYLNIYFKLNIERPSKVHSLILVETIKYLETNEINDVDFNFFDFLKLWDINNFMEEDYEENVFTNKDGKKITYSPLVVKAVKKASGYLQSLPKIDCDITWFMEFLKSLLEKINDVWLIRSYALLCYKLGEKDTAISKYKAISVDLNSKSYYWKEFGDMFRNDNIELTKAMYIKGVSLDKDDFTIKIRLKLAKLFYEINDLPQAKYHIDKYISHKQEKGHKIDNDALDIEKKLKDIKAVNNNNLLREANNLIDDFLYSDIPWIDCVLINSFKNKKNKTVYKFTNFSDTDIEVTAKEFEKEQELYSSYRFKIIKDNNGKKRVVKKEKIDIDINNFDVKPPYKSATGVIKLCSKDKSSNEIDFGFVSNIYVSKKILTLLNINEEVELFIIAKKDEKTNKDNTIYAKIIDN